MLNRGLISWLVALVLAGGLTLGGCDDESSEDTGGDADTDMDVDTDTDTDTDTDVDTDADTDADGDYFEDGYCGDFGNSIPASTTCGPMASLGMIGCCDAEGRTIWCDGGQLWCIDCANSNSYCGWSDEYEWYDCGVDEEQYGDPSGTYPYYCPQTDPDTDPEGDYWVDGYCPGESLVASLDCGGIEGVGCCDDDHNALWCEDGNLFCAPCESLTATPFCGWLVEGSDAHYRCTADESGQDPSGVEPYLCSEVLAPEPDAGTDAG